MALHRVKIFSIFERFWHWAQMLLILVLLVTGFGLHGFHDLFTFKQAVTLHTAAALTLLLLWAFGTFWLFTTRNWRHFIPTVQGMWGVFRYYSFGIFKGERHPYRKAYWRKHNPLQALAYTMLKLVLFPAIWITGLIYLFYFAWRDIPHATEYLQGVAMVHVAAAFAILTFVFIHVYMLTTGHSFRDHVMPMFTGFDEVDLTPEEEAYLRKDQPQDIR
ncbi:MAG: cytochrome b/b6 domain-containing protein [Thiohalocapsa sp.]|jgi:thiosulfate reductase cytochrome b subunit|uniref:cytochrome b/b6 domain-containing protein n=1 Tax=Thiohalocapsa sp. TaxID=2497641 RepID=UPI0025EE9525|nr:cytochrome b/b6 domain-containing protein [Thiohalocapsa sp.]MCG6942163.1 cytochrome b/b6 domain-containing protein [Thiohalocapsa sp.]